MLAPQSLLMLHFWSDYSLIFWNPIFPAKLWATTNVYKNVKICFVSIALWTQAEPRLNATWTTLYHLAPTGVKAPFQCDPVVCMYVLIFFLSRAGVRAHAVAEATGWRAPFSCIHTKSGHVGPSCKVVWLCARLFLWAWEHIWHETITESHFISLMHIQSILA